MRSWNLRSLLAGIWNMELPWETIWLVLAKLNTELAGDLAVPLLGAHTRGWRTYTHIKKKNTRMFKLPLQVEAT